MLQVCGRAITDARRDLRAESHIAIEICICIVPRSVVIAKQHSTLEIIMWPNLTDLTGICCVFEIVQLKTRVSDHGFRIVPSVPKLGTQSVVNHLHFIPIVGCWVL